MLIKILSQRLTLMDVDSRVIACVFYMTTLASPEASVFENEVNKLLDMIKIHPFFGAFFLKDSLVNQSEKIKPLLLASPEPSLIYRFGLESRDVTFVRVKSANSRSSELVFALEHLWKIPGGYVIVRDLIYFTHIPTLKNIQLQGIPAVQRLIILLDNYEQNPRFEPLKCSLVMRGGLVLMVQTYNKSVVLFSDGGARLKHLPVKSVQTLLNSKKSFRSVEVICHQKGTLNTAVDNHEKRMSARREYLVETRGNKLAGVEQTLLAREAAVKATETALNLRESAAKASEDAVSQRENSVRSEKATIKHDKEALKLYELNLRYTEERLQEKDEKLN
ncbi:uncharacterized protein EAF02_009845 [Botrytis sinoallii]|uniref:uncharacterized protein n=1 Tax=Botrytis sinoallii TaxID=1463999 RepID=UPI0019000CDD|nr:uncharacterized protein EAF02_009845 [Botrytis sinoallii]KAF7867059.1 hypothetical protein EAF02_009845 [Botrytis sinoallii]